MKFWHTMITEWWGILIICVVCAAVWILLSALLYRQFFKRFYDIVLSAIAIIVFSPFLIVLTVIGAIAMKGNPFFVQKRPGRRKKLSKKQCKKQGVPYGTYGEEKIISLLKFRTMTNEKDENGELLPDEKRLNGYGKFLRSTSLDELPSLINIFNGNMSIVGPRPLLVKYLPLYNEEQRHRHDVRPGLTGLAQVNGRNAINWEEKFLFDIDYVNKITLWRDIGILFQTVGKVFKRSGISQEGQATMGEFLGSDNKKEKDNQPLISVIVPVYNIEKYVGECIESILNQAYSNLEIILVDDGSIDESGAICDSYAKCDKRIVVIHKKNGGLVSARKAGLNKASGKYVGYVDGDDWVGKEFYRNLLRVAESHNSDMVAAGYTRDFLGKTEIKKNGISCGLYSGSELDRMRSEFISLGNIYNPGIYTYVWNKLFLRKSLIDFQNAVPNELTIGEDAAVVFPMICRCESVTVIDDCSYRYRQHEQSMIKKTSWSEKTYKGLQVLTRFLCDNTRADCLKAINGFLLNLFLIHSGSRINKEFIFDKNLNDKSLVLYSGGTFGQYIMKGSEECGISFVDWVDDDFDEYRACGLDVNPVSSIIDKNYDYILIASTNNALSEKIYESLASIGISKEKILYYDFSESYIDSLFAKYMNVGDTK